MDKKTKRNILIIVAILAVALIFSGAMLDIFSDGFYNSLKSTFTASMTTGTLQCLSFYVSQPYPEGESYAKYGYSWNPYKGTYCKLVSCNTDTKKCPDGSIVARSLSLGCEFNTCLSYDIPSPEPPANILSMITNFFSALWASIKSLFGLNIVSSTQTAYVGDTLSDTFTVSTNVPYDSDYTDGTRNYFYSAWTVYDGSGNVLKQDYKEVNTSTVQQPVAYKFTKSGKHTVVVALLSIDKVFDRNTGTWTQSPLIELNKQVAQIDVREIGAPTAPTNILDSIKAFFSGIWGWILSWFK